MLRPKKPVVTCPGNKASVEAMFAARASSPVSIRDGKVMKEPPPARAFCVPAQTATTNNKTNTHIGARLNSTRRNAAALLKD
jgi:hypothetical protein